MRFDGGYTLVDGIYTCPRAVVHREEEYNSHGFELLRKMQRRHFWYQGRHRFLLHAVHRQLARGPASPRRLIDLGGGCGGWVNYCLKRAGFPIEEAALGDSSATALRWARAYLPDAVRCYQIDLRALHWENRWDLAFLLDVLEHIPEQHAALRQIWRALKPGGLLFVTTPALKLFWSWVDEANGHQRRYTRRDYRRLAADCVYELLEARYFMFLLSPLYFASRLRGPRNLSRQPRAQVRRRMEAMHHTPPGLINALLKSIFWCETPLGHHVPFPWGTSILAVLRKPPSVGSPAPYA
jgi:SAM-dependent methyltransferase